MSEEMVIRHCSPTLAGMKTGSLFYCSYGDGKQLTQELCRFNRMLAPKGVRMLPLRTGGGRALIYLYRPNALRRDFADLQARRLLEENDYLPERVNQCVIRLIQRLKSEGTFPHEIGLFLGYPPEDVLGFIHNKGRNHKCIGCWKVYGDEATARAVFRKYRECTRIYCRQWRQGKSIERLTVAG